MVAVLLPSAAPTPAGETAAASLLDRAEELIFDDNYAHRGTAHFELHTDDPRLRLEAAGDLLESFREFFDSFRSGKKPLPDPGEPARIFLFYSRFKYRQLLQPAGRRFGDVPPGHYRPHPDLIALHTDSVGPADFPDMLVHEAAHQMIRRRWHGPGGSPAPWLDEGLASYFGFTERDASGRFRAGRIGGKRARLFRDRPPKGWGERSERLARLRKELGRDPDFSLDALIRMDDPETFYGEGVDLHYTASWVLVHFLLHGEEGALAPGLLEYLDEGSGGADAFYRRIHADPAGLESSFRAYARRLKAR